MGRRTRAPHWPSERPSQPTSEMRCGKSQEGFQMHQIGDTVCPRRSDAHERQTPTEGADLGTRMWGLAVGYAYPTLRRFRDWFPRALQNGMFSSLVDDGWWCGFLRWRRIGSGDVLGLAVATTCLVHVPSWPLSNVMGPNRVFQVRS